MLEASPLGRPFQPLTLVAYRVDTGPLFDARDAGRLASQGFRPDDLANPDWEGLMLDGQEPAQHRFVRTLRAAGHVGVVVPSFAHGAGAGDANLVLWEWADTGGSTVTVVDDDRRLPRDDASWSRIKDRKVETQDFHGPT